MLVLTIYQYRGLIKYEIFRHLNRKFILQNYGKININDQGVVDWVIYNSQHRLIKEDQLLINIHNDVPDYVPIISNREFTQYNFAYIVHKIANGGEHFKDITLINPAILTQLASPVLNSLQQTQDLNLVEKTYSYFRDTKHYTCFDSGFHQSIDLVHRLLSFQTNNQANKINYAPFGLIFAGINKQLAYLSDKQSFRGKWIILYLEDNLIMGCAIRVGKSTYTSLSTLEQLITKPDNSMVFDLIGQPITTITELLELENDLNAELATDYLINQIYGQIAQLIYHNRGVDGIIFTGELGISNHKLRYLICQKLEWQGVAISNKSNLEQKCKLHKKSSSIELFALVADHTIEMLNQLLTRI
jgi:acetate kinase